METPLRRNLLAKRQRRGRYWDGYRSSGDIEELQRLVERAVPFLEVGDGSNALSDTRADCGGVR